MQLLMIICKKITLKSRIALVVQKVRVGVRVNPELHLVSLVQIVELMSRRQPEASLDVLLVMASVAIWLKVFTCQLAPVNNRGGPAPAGFDASVFAILIFLVGVLKVRLAMNGTFPTVIFTNLESVQLILASFFIVMTMEAL